MASSSSSRAAGGRGSTAAPEPERNWEDEYKRLREENIGLKQLCNEQEDHIRRLLAKIRKIEADFSVLSAQQGSATGTTAQPRNRQEEDLIKTLYDQVNQLKAKNAKLTQQNEKLTDQYERKKREVSILSKTRPTSAKTSGVSASGTVARPSSAPRGVASSSEQQQQQSLRNSLRRSNETDIEIRATSARRPQDGMPERGPVKSSIDSMDAAHHDLLRISQNLKERLTNAEAQLVRAREENASLRTQMSSSGKPPVMPSSSGSSSGDLESKLRDANWRLQRLQTEYDHAVARLNAQKDSSKKMDDDVDSYAQKVRDLRRALEDLRHEKELSDIKAGRVSELEETVIELRKANRSLEEKLARLCETPFIGEAFGHQESQSRIEEMVREKADLQTKIDHLQEAVRTHYSALVTLRQQASKLREEKEQAERKADEIASKQHDLQVGQSILQDKLKMYSGEDGVSVEELERALTVVRRRAEASKSNKLDFLEDSDNSNGLSSDPTIMKRKIQELQVLNLNLSREAERLESMLKLQSGINRDLHKELEMVVATRDKDKADIIKRAENFEELAARRQEKILALESQVRQHIYSVSKKGKKSLADVSKPVSAAADSNLLDTTMDSDNGLLADLVAECDGDVQPDENLIEVWVKDANIKDHVLTPGCSTFLVTDFFDYESQSTGLASGNHPKWDFATTFKISVDDFLLRYLASDVITFELNIACQGDFTMIGRCTAPLSPLLKSKPMIRLVNHPVLSVRTSEVVATINVEIRLALPVSELYRLFLERHPREKAIIEDMSNKRIIDNAQVVEKSKVLGADAIIRNAREDESRMFNELEVSIVSAEGLSSSSDGKAPSPYVLFQLLGNPDKFTNPVMNTNSPVMNEKFAFPMITNETQIRLLRRSQLLLQVLDMREEELVERGAAKSKDDSLIGLIGEVSVSLAALSDGSSIVDSFTIRNADGKSCGKLSIALRWKSQFKGPRELGPRALSEVELEMLIAAFEGGVGKEGGVDYRAFLRFIDPPASVTSALSKLQKYVQRISDKDGIKAIDAITTILEAKNGRGSASQGVREDAFVASFIGIELDVLPAEYAELFRFVDSDNSGTVTGLQLLVVLNLDEAVAIPGILLEKLRTRIRDLESRNVSVPRLFEKADTWGTKGVITRLDFKTVLYQMGFQLPDDPSEPLLQARANRSIQGAGIDGSDALNDTMESEELHESAAARLGLDGRQSLTDEARKHREIFERKLQEIQLRTKEVAQLHQSGPLSTRIEPSAVSNEKIISGKGVNLLSSKLDAAAEAEDHRAGIKASAPVDRSLDAAAMHSNPPSSSPSTPPRIRAEVNIAGNTPTATKPPLRSSNLAAGEREGDENDQRGRMESNIIDAEQELRTAVLEMQKIGSAPAFIESFVTLDGKKRGFVNRKQFAMALRQQKGLEIRPEYLRVLMDYFDISGNGADIDYNAFVSFANYKPMEVLPASRLASSIVISREGIDQLRSADVNGTGMLRRQDMLRGLADIGYGHWPQAQSFAVMSLFETKIEGQVNYGNLIEFASETPLAVRYEEVESALLNIIAPKPSDAEDEANVRKWFRKIDKTGSGSISVNDLASFLGEFDLGAPKPVVFALFRSMQLGTNVGVQELARWAKRKHSQQKLPASGMFDRLSLADLQRKAGAYILALAVHRDGALNEVQQSFQIYDVSRPAKNAIGKMEFANAALRAGFPFSSSELDALAVHFAAESGKVAYRKFLSWATPSSSSAARKDEESERSSVHHVNAITKILTKSLERGVDVMSVFGRYDPVSSGRIASDEFCAALSDLGLSSVNSRQALDFADRYRAAAGDLVMYRRILTELWRKIDDDKQGGGEKDNFEESIAAKLVKAKVDIKRLRELFEYYDPKNTGAVRSDDIGTIFDECRVPLRRIEVDAIAEKYVSRQSGQSGNFVRYPAFINALFSKVDNYAAPHQSRVGPASVSSELEAKVVGLFETLILRGLDFRGAFDAADAKFAGAIALPDFKSIWMDQLDPSFSEEDLDCLAKKYRDRDDPRMVSHVRLIRDLHPRFYKSSGLSRANGPEDDALDMQLDGVIAETAEMLRCKIRRRYDYMTPGELRSPFHHFAGSRQAEVVLPDEFSLGMRKLGIRAAADQERAVFDLININGTKGFTYPEFVVFVCDPLHADVAWKLRRLLSRHRIQDQEIVDALNEVDANSSGLLTSKQFAKAMKNLRVELSESDISRLLLRFDPEGAQRFDIDSFAAFLKGAKSVSRDGERESRDRPSTSEASETATWNGLRKAVQGKLKSGYTAAEIFAIFDPEDKRTVDLTSLQEGAREVGLTLSRLEARALLRRMSVMSGGTVDRGNFFSSLDIDIKETRRAEASSDKESGRRVSDENSAKGRRLLMSLRDELSKSLERGRGSVTREVLRAMDAEDDDRDGKVSSREFIRALGKLSTSLSRSELLEVFDYCCATSGAESSQLLGTSVFAELLFGTDRDSRDVDREDRARDRDRDEDRSSNRTRERDADRDDRTSDRDRDRPSRSTSKKLTRTDESDLKDSVVRLFTKRRDIVDSLISIISVSKSKGVSLSSVSVQCEKIDLDGNGYVPKFDFADAFSRAGLVFKSDFERDFVDSISEAQAGVLSGLTGKSSNIAYDSVIRAIEAEIRAEDEAEEVLDKLRRKIAREIKHPSELEDLFSRMDSDRSGRISIDEFERGMRKIGLEMTRDEVKRVMSRFSTMAGSINSKDFLRAFSPSLATAPSSKRDADGADFVESLIRRVRGALESRLGTSYALSRRLMQQVFDEIDVDKDNSLSLKELVQAFEQLRVDITTREAERVIAYFDPKEHNRLRFVDFMNLLGAPADADKGDSAGDRVDRDRVRERERDSDKAAESGDEVRKLVMHIRSVLERTLGSEAQSARRIKESFAEIDRDNSGCVDQRELARAMRSLGVELTSREVDMLFRRYDSDRSGTMDYGEFIRLLGFKAPGR